MVERYSLPEMAAVWAPEVHFRTENEARSRMRASFSVERILELERETRHDVVAVTRAVSESLGPERKRVRYGLTSTDVVDTALGAQLRQANQIILPDSTLLVNYVLWCMAGIVHALRVYPDAMRHNMERSLGLI